MKNLLIVAKDLEIDLVNLDEKYPPNHPHLAKINPLSDLCGKKL